MSQAASIERIRKLLPPQGQVLFDGFVTKNVLPDLPEGWHLDKLQEFRGSFIMTILCKNRCKNIIGKTIIDAINNAIRSVNDDARS